MKQTINKYSRNNEKHMCGLLLVKNIKNVNNHVT